MAESEATAKVSEPQEVGGAIDFDGIAPAMGLVGSTSMPGHPQLSTMALALGTLTKGETRIERCSRRPEVVRMVDLLERLGASIAFDGEIALVTGGSAAVEGGLDAPNRAALAGVTGVLANRASGGTVTADPSVHDPRSILEALEAYGVVVRNTEDAPLPAEIGTVAPKPGTHTVGQADSDVKTAVFLAAIGQSGTFELRQDLAGEDDLEPLFRSAGIRLEKGRVPDGDGYRFTLVGPQSPEATRHVLPGDTTATLVALCLAAILPQSEFTVEDAGTDWKTRRLIDLVRRFGVTVEIEKTRTESGVGSRAYRVKGGEDLRRIKISGEYSELFLDEIPIFAVVAAGAEGQTVIRDIADLRSGGVDVLSLMTENLRRMEVRVGEMPDGIVIEGVRSLQGAEFDAGGDSRVTLAMMVAGLAAEGGSRIVNPGPVREAYPGLLERIETVLQLKGR